MKSRYTIALFCSGIAFFLITLSFDKTPFISPPSIGPFINGIFPKSPPGDLGSWKALDNIPNIDIPSPLRIIPFPTSEDVLVLSKVGELWKVNLEDQSMSEILDIRERTISLGEGGAVSLALHPDFETHQDRQFLFIFYRYKPNPTQWDDRGFNRLSKFSWDSTLQKFDESSEEILIQQYDRSPWHNGGGLFFDADGFLVLAVGDEGAMEFQSESTQRLDGGLFSGVLRLDINNNPELSTPINRQPIALGNPPQGWGETFTQGYGIPKDNPWLSEDGSHLEEYFALGVRSPYSMHYDSITDKIWLADVGSNVMEEINIVEKGDNLQWPYVEGTQASEFHTAPVNLIGNEKTPVFEYERSVGTSVIGGGVYHGTQFPSLNQRYIFADYVFNKLMAINKDDLNGLYESETLIADLQGFDLPLPETPGITGVHILADGRILLTVSGEDFQKPGRILELDKDIAIPDPPKKLSDLGVFKDLDELEPIDGIIPYEVNSPLWSDRAEKKRWMAIPNHTETSILFNNFGSWDFPEGTVFIKHFELPLDDDPNGSMVRLETRFFVMGENNAPYGLTYQWNDEGTEAELLTVSDSKLYELNNGKTQQWEFPGRDQCLSCHNKNANSVLGVNTHQLNSTIFYPFEGIEMNQLEYLSFHGYINADIENAQAMPKSYSITDQNSTLDQRIFSYLDSNCSSCHRPGGVLNLGMDLRYHTPLTSKNIVNFDNQSESSTVDGVIVLPGKHEDSELWMRDASEEENRMPPISRNLLHDTYLDSLARWIDLLKEEDLIVRESKLFPNPAREELTLSFSDDWTFPAEISIYSVHGKRVYYNTTELSSNNIQIQNLPPGIYFLLGESETNEIMIQFVKQ